MPRVRIKLSVYIDLDPVPGNMHSAESAHNNVRFILQQTFEAYNPTVSLESSDTSKTG